MTGHPVEAAWWDEERNGWVYPGGILGPAEIVGGRDLPEQHDRAAPFGIEYEVDEPCTCEIETMYTHPGIAYMTSRTPDPADPCPHPGHDLPEIHRY